MLKATLPAVLAFVLLAAASYRFRREAGIDAATVPVLRIGAAALLTISLWLAGSPLPGERIVRFLGAMSLAAAVVVLSLSFAPMLTLRPVRALLGAGRR